MVDKKQPPRLINVNEYGISDHIKTMMIECPACHHKWVAQIIKDGYIMESDLTCKKCGNVIVDLK